MENRDKKTFNEIDLYQLFIGQKVDNLVLIEDNINNVDPEDGGGDHYYAILDKTTGKYYSGDYCEWDIYYNFDYDEETGKVSRCDFNNELTEVFPKQKTITVYE